MNEYQPDFYEDDLALLTQSPDQWPSYHGYLPLKESEKEVRLLEISFIPDTEDLRGSISHVSLLDDPVYDALSYCWGPPCRMQPIWINGEEVLIGSSLWSFLFMLCLNGQHTPVWIDSVCINQKDVLERNWQVQMMGEIYSRAQTARAWLGDGNTRMEYVFAYVNCWLYDQSRISNMQANIPHLRAALDELQELDYWRKLWIIQELALAKTIVVHCGRRCISWNSLCKFIASDTATSCMLLRSFTNSIESLRLGHSSDIRSDCPSFLDSTRFPHRDRHDPGYFHERGFSRYVETDHRKQYIDPKYITNLLSEFADQRCMDDRDKIFALRSLMVDGKLIQVNYEHSLADLIFNFYQGIHARSVSTDHEVLEAFLAGFASKFPIYWFSIRASLRILGLGSEERFEHIYSAWVASRLRSLSETNKPESTLLVPRGEMAEASRASRFFACGDYCECLASARSFSYRA